MQAFSLSVDAVAVICMSRMREWCCLLLKVIECLSEVVVSGLQADSDQGSRGRGGDGDDSDDEGVYSAATEVTTLQ